MWWEVSLTKCMRAKQPHLSSHAPSNQTQLIVRDAQVGSHLHELLLQYHHTPMDQKARASLTQRIVDGIDDMVYNYLVAGMRNPLLLKKMTVGGCSDDDLLLQPTTNVCVSAATLQHIQPHVVCVLSGVQHICPFPTAKPNPIGCISTDQSPSGGDCWPKASICEQVDRVA